MKKYEELRIKNYQKGRTYYKVCLLDEEGYDSIELIGRYATLKDAKIACDNYRNEEIDGPAEFRIIEYVSTINDYIGGVRTEREVIFY